MSVHYPYWKSGFPPRGLAALRRGMVLLTLLLAGTESVAATPPPLVQAVLDNEVPRAEQRCSYARTRIDGDHSRRELYRPDVPGYPWSLQVVDGRDPTPAELRRFEDDQDDRERRHPLSFDLRDMVAGEGWVLRSETPTEAVFEFRLQPYEDLDEHLVDKVVGTLVVDKSRRQPRRVRIANTEPAYIAPFVRIASYVQELSFRWNEALGMAVLAQIETRWRGRALGLKVIRKHEVLRYDDYQCAPLTPGASAADGTP